RIACNRCAAHVNRPAHKPKNPSACQRRVHGWRPKSRDAHISGRDGLCLVNLVVLKAAEEKRSVLDDRATDSKAVLIELQLRAFFAFIIAEPFVGVIVRVAVEVEHRAVNRIGAGSGSYNDVRSAIAALFSSGAQRDSAELLDIVGIQPLDIALWVGHRGLVGVNAVNRDVMRAVTGTKYVR